ncbi:MAG: zinc-binding dehydrogenase [Candidatus Binatia bacterium]
MRAAVMRSSELVVDTVPDPVPGPGEAIVKTLACGICGSDLHALKFADKLVESARETDTPFNMDPSRDVVLGHEFCVEVLDYGPDTDGSVKPGGRAVSMPLLFRATGIHGVGFSNEIPGGYGELMVLNASLLLEVPNGLPTEHAAMTEPMAVGLHAVEKARLDPGDAAMVFGCGPVGLAVIAALKLKGVEPIVAGDFSPMRRELGRMMGAHVLVDPKVQRVIDAYRDAADLRPAAVFECVGVPGVLQEVMRQAPHGAKIVVAGVCMEDDRIRPMLGINKELSLQFVLGYTPIEFADTLGALADGRVDVSPLVTGRVGVDGVAQAFRDLGSPERHAKILVEPWRS